MSRFRLHIWSDLRVSDQATAFHAWCEMIRHGYLYQTPYVVVLRVEATRQARGATAVDVAVRRYSWLSWSHDGPVAGPGRQHRVSRVTNGWVPFMVVRSEENGAGDVDLHMDAEEEAELCSRDRRAVPLHTQQEV